MHQIVLCVPWGGTRTLPQGCTIASWLFLLWFFTLSLPWSATVYICPLELKEGLGGRNFSSYKQKTGDTEGFLSLGGPHRVLLGFTSVCGYVNLMLGNFSGVCDDASVHWPPAMHLALFLLLFKGILLISPLFFLPETTSSSLSS